MLEDSNKILEGGGKYRRHLKFRKIDEIKSKNQFKIMTTKAKQIFDKINKTFRDLNSLNLIELFDLKRENELLGYSSQDIDLHFLKWYLFFCQERYLQFESEF